MKTYGKTCLALAALVLAACGGNPGPREPQPTTTVRIENQSSLDMNIYVLRGAQRIRLGTATAHTTSRLTLPPDILFGPTPLRFLADPIGSTRTPITNEISVMPGDEVVLRIPPNP